LLDAGSGNGRYLKELAKYYRVVGADVSFTALQSSRNRLAKSGFLAEHAVASLHTLPFRPGSFEGVLCYGVLQHLFQSERMAAVLEFKRVLRKGGLVFFEVFGSEDMRFGGKAAGPEGEPPEENTFLRQSGIIYHYFTEKEILSLFEGFEVLDLQEVKREKKFRGEVYIRQQFRGVFRLL
ncbi:MAG: class I SAM-dependent methyltransferase, partial [Methanosarcinaceae archaeon]|nr:class I SAM-dependent methyltransferase [Methanosarcinaceae archaeon]